MFCARVGAGAVLVLVICGADHAQGQQSQPGSPAITLPAVDVTASSDQAVTSAAPFDVKAHPAGQTITTVDQEQTQDAPDFAIGEVLRAVPGVTLKQGNGPRDQGISIRGSNARNGFGIRNIVVFEDGFPVTQPDGLSRTDLTDPHAYRSIDVFRGPSSAMFGNYATGGAINFHLWRGSDIQGLWLGSDAGSFNYFNEYALFGDQLGNFEYSGIVSHVRSDGFQRNQSFNTTTGDILASYAPTPDDKLVFKVIDNYVGTALPIRLSLNQFNANPFQRGCLTPTAAAGCASINVFANGRSGATVPLTADQAGLGRHDQRTILGTRWEHSFGADTLWRTQFVYDNKDINQPTGATSAIGDQPAFNLLSDVTSNGNLLGIPATHYAAFSFNRVHLSNDTYNVAPGGNARLGALSSSFFGYQQNLGGRAREELRLDPYWTAVAGFGVEQTIISALDEVFAFPTATTTTTTLIPVNRDFLNVAPELALFFRPTDAWQFRGRIAGGYGTPQASNLFVTPQGVAGNNTRLKTQENTGIDLGVDWSPAETLKLNLTGFYEFFRNELVTQSPGAGLQSFTFNAPESEHRGIEAGLDWRPLPGWRVWLAYLFDDQVYTRYAEQLSAGAKTASFNRAGNKIPGVEPNNLLTRLSYDEPGGPWAGLGGFVEFYWRDAFFMDNANLIKAPSYTLVNLNLHYDPSVQAPYLKGMRLFFEVQNLFNKTYVASANNVSDSISATSGLQNPASVLAGAGGSIYAGAPRSFVGGIKVKF
jgi:iron complex outermembrane receptor protein